MNPGICLEVNLTKHSIIRRDLPSSWLEESLGGVGYSVRYLYEQLPVETEPLGPDNILTFARGTLAGTHFPTACRVEASARSPLTGLLGTSNSGFYFGGAMSRAGVDLIAITGQSEEPCLLYIDDSNARLILAQDLWGQDCWQTLDYLRQHYPGMEAAVIGPAGERLVRFASIENGYYDAWGRTGLGAVMGSKRLKGVLIGGQQGLRPERRSEFIQVVAEANRAIRSSSFYAPFKKYGTMLATLPYAEFSALPAHNFSVGKLDGWEEKCSRLTMGEHTKRGVACQACPIACAHWVEINTGDYAGIKLKDFEVTPVMAFGAQCGLNALPACAAASALGQRLGMDLISAGSVVAMACELGASGVLSRQDVGYDLAFGQAEGILRLMEDIAYRRGVGELLAEGSQRAADTLGDPGAAMQVKGLELPMFDPRGRWSTWSLGMLTNIRGGDHLRCRNPVENLRFNERKRGLIFERYGFDEQMYRDLDMPEPIKQAAINQEQDTVNIPIMSRWAEDLIHLFNMTGVCIRPPVLHRVGPTLLTQALSALTGVDFAPEQIIRAAEKSWNQARLFNLRAGETAKESRFPARFYDGEGALKAAEVNEALQYYYVARGWDTQGRPTPEKLKALGLM